MTRTVIATPLGSVDIPVIFPEVHGGPIDAPIANSAVRNANTHGVLKLKPCTPGYDWQFLPVAGSTFTESGSASC